MSEKFKGLTNEQVEESRKLHGSNKLTQKEGETFWQKLWDTFAGDPIIKILVVALVINLCFVFMGKAEWYEAVGIAIAVILATVISTWSEHSNEESFQKLQEDASKIKIKVFRNGEICEILIDDIVTGDIVMLQSGDKIPADGILVQGSLRIDQSALNGESKEAKKVTAPEGYEMAEEVDFLNEYQLYRGSVVCSGEALMEVKIVGDKSEFGKLAQEMQTEERESPLKLRLGQLADSISKLGYFGSIAIAISYLFKKIVIDNGYDMAVISQYLSDWQNPANDIVTAVILAVIIIVMAVPEGLPMMIAMVLSLNMKKLLADNILVRKLVGIETAGSLNILFSDKTGTITKGQLDAVTIVTGENSAYESIDKMPNKIRELVNVSLQHNTNAVINKTDNKVQVIGGNATERALLKFVSDEDISSLNIEHVKTIPFNSENKYSATQVKGNYNLTLLKGAPERVLEKCKFYYDENGNKVELKNKKDLDNRILELANRAIRVIAIATSDEELEETNDFNDLTLVGIVGIRDDLRPESVEAIKTAKNAGIQVVMITGDNKETAVAIAKEAGLIECETNIVLTSFELKELSDEELKKMLPNIRVIARALPTDKSRLVRIAQELDLVVGMTGDGVNDAPALKLADVGFAMGSGTEVAKEAGDIVILDDNFKSITQTVLYGRTIFNSIRKFIVFQLTTNVGALLIAFFGPFVGVDMPLSITQILWVNLVMDTLAALAFGGEPALSKYMEEEPKTRTEALINKDMWSSILTGGIFLAGMSIFYLKSPWMRSMFRTGVQGQEDIYFLTGFFAFFIFLNGFNTFNARTTDKNLLAHITENEGFLKIVAIIFIVQIIMTYFGGEVLRTSGLTLSEWIPVTILGAMIIPVDLIRKTIRDMLAK